MQRYSFQIWAATLIPAFITWVLPRAAEAYVGPGAGVTAIGAVLSLIGAVLLSIVGFVWYPIRRLLRARKGAKPSNPAPINNAAEINSGS